MLVVRMRGSVQNIVTRVAEVVMHPFRIFVRLILTLSFR